MEAEMKLLRADTCIELLDVRLWLFVGNGDELDVAIKGSRFGEIKENSDGYAGRAFYKGSYFGIAIHRRELTHEVIAHEVFHITHAMWEFVGDKFSAKHHEPYSYLCGHITEWVYRQLKKARIKVSI